MTLTSNTTSNSLRINPLERSRVDLIADSLVETIVRVGNQVIQSIADKVEASAESYPRTVNVFKPILMGLFKFSHNFPTLSTGVIVTTLATTIIAQAIVIGLILTYVMPTAISGILSLTFSILATMSTTMLYNEVCKELRERHLNQSNDITNINNAFFNIDSQSLSKLNAWVNEQRAQENPNWSAARDQLVKMFYTGSTSLEFVGCQLTSLPDIFDAPAFQKLESLNLKGNSLTDLPLSIRNLNSLKSLNLSQNSTLDHVPEAIFQLPHSCQVHINDCNLSDTYLEDLPNVLRTNNSKPMIDYFKSAEAARNRARITNARILAAERQERATAAEGISNDQENRLNNLISRAMYWIPNLNY